MRLLTIIAVVICMCACSKNNNENELPSGVKLVSVEYIDPNQSWMENYSYSTNGALSVVEDSRPTGRRHEIDYENSKLREYNIYEKDERAPVFRDSMLYDDNGSIKAIHKFSINSGADLALQWIFEYEYDNENRLAKKSSYLARSQKYSSMENYFWNGGNIERVEYRSGKDELLYEFFYKYDDKINYKKGIPIHISDPLSWTNNNITEMRYKDYLGNLDLACGPCITEYSYNRDNYPILVKTNWERTLVLSYE